MTPATERQQREIDFYSRREWLNAVDFERMERQPRWFPEGRLFERIREAYRGPQQRLLEFGCGRGQRSAYYARIGYQVSAFDLAPNQVENARFLAEKYDLSDRIEFSVQAAEQLDYPDHHFDIAAGVNILHHVELPTALRQLQRVLKPDGQAVFVDSLATPRRDRIRNSRVITWLMPKCHVESEDEHPMTAPEIALIRELFPGLVLERFRVLGLMSTAMGMALFRRKRRVARSLLFRLDASLFRIAPFVRRWGDQVVLTLRA